MTNNKSIPDDRFLTLMRRKTREIHDLSDTLVQSKFLLGLIDDKVWAEGLLVFYEIFKFLEDCIENLEGSNVSKFYNPEMFRTRYFEADLEFYYGSHWKANNPRRKCVQEYISHLEQLRSNNSDLLIAYIYHLYLGLLSGGRILRRKQKLFALSKFSKISSVVDFDNDVVSRLKEFIKQTTLTIVQDMTEKKKENILEESITVFKLNCELIRSVSSANSNFKRLLIIFISGILVAAVLFYYFSNDSKQDL